MVSSRLKRSESITRHVSFVTTVTLPTPAQMSNENVRNPGQRMEKDGRALPVADGGAGLFEFPCSPRGTATLPSFVSSLGATSSSLFSWLRFLPFFRRRFRRCLQSLINSGNVESFDHKHGVRSALRRGVGLVPGDLKHAIQFDGCVIGQLVSRDPLDPDESVRRPGGLDQHLVGGHNLLDTQVS